MTQQRQQPQQKPQPQRAGRLTRSRRNKHNHSTSHSQQQPLMRDEAEAGDEQFQFPHRHLHRTRAASPDDGGRLVDFEEQIELAPSRPRRLALGRTTLDPNSLGPERDNYVNAGGRMLDNS